MPRSPTGRPFSVSGGGGRGDIPHIRLPSSMRPSTTQSVISKLNVKKMDMVEGGGMGMCGLECNNHCGLICIVFSVIFVISGVLLTIVGFRYRDRDKDTSSDSYFFGNKKTLQIGGPVLMFAGFLMLFLGVVFCFLKYKVKQNAREEAEYMKEYHCSGNHDTEHHMDLSSSYRKGSAMSSVNQIRATSSVRPWQNGDSLTLGNYARPCTQSTLAESFRKASVLEENGSSGTLITEGVLKDNLPALDTATEVGSTGCGAPAANGGVRLSVGLPPPQLLPHTPTPMTPPASDSVCHTCARPSTATNMLGYRQSFGDLTSTRISDVACFPPEPEEESSPVVSSSPRLSKTSLSTGTLSSNPCSRPASAPQEQRNVTANVIPPTPPYNDVTVPVDT